MNVDLSRRAALYVRVSGEDQAKEGFSLSAQEYRLRAYAEAQGWTVAAIYRDEGYSGRNLNRPQYRAAMAEKGSWDVLVVLKLDRLHRNLPNLLAMVADLQAADKDFASIMESLDTSTAIGRFVLTIMGSLAQLESEQIGERVLVGMTEKARLGRGSLGAPTPFGYVRSNGKLFPAAMEAPIVQEMFRLARAGMKPAGIAKFLNKQWIGARWDRWKVHRLLRNPTYAGCTLWSGIGQKDTHEALVPMDTFNEVQRLHKTGVELS